MLRCALAAALALALAIWMMPARQVLAPVATAAELPAAISGMYLHVPRDVPAGTPVQALVVLHGLGGNGDQFGSKFVAEAERNHWLLIAPTITYGDWTDPNQVAGEDPRLIRWLSDTVDHLSDSAGLSVKPRVLLLGHSRGAQLALRFALFEPQRVLAVAAVGAGTYTLPVERSAAGTLLRFPFGLGDLRTIAGHRFSQTMLVEDTDFFLGVGAEDNDPADLPRAWDPYLGGTRVQRARVFQDALHVLGARSVLVVFRGERHALSPSMVVSASSFLRAIDLAHMAPTPADNAPKTGHASHTRARF